MDHLDDTIQQTFSNVYRSPCEHTGECRAYCYIKEHTTNTNNDETSKKQNNKKDENSSEEEDEKGNTRNYYLCIQMNIGPPFDYYDTTTGYLTSGIKRKNKGRDF